MRHLPWIILFAALPAWAQEVYIDSYIFPTAGALEAIAPDAIISQTNYSTCVITEISDDPDAGAGGDWCDEDAHNAASIMRASFPTPVSSPTGSNCFDVFVRLSDQGGTGNPDLIIGVRETGDAANDDTGPTESVVSTTGEKFTFCWDAAVLETADGSAVEIYIDCDTNGGGPNANTCDIGGVEWDKN